MKKIVFVLILIFVLMEGVSWMVLKSLKEEAPSTSKVIEQETRIEPKAEASKQENPETSTQETVPTPQVPIPIPYSGMGNTDPESFPPPSTEVKDGRTERTIHVGVRQYTWDPLVLRAEKGELVRLIIHNADVKHGLVIPDLGVDQDIPPDGAVVEFVASKVGTFEFFCSVWCGEGHMEMRGKIVIE